MGNLLARVGLLNPSLDLVEQEKSLHRLLYGGFLRKVLKNFQHFLLRYRDRHS